MRDHPRTLPEVLTGSFTTDVTVDVWHGAERVANGLRVEAWSLSGDLSREVKSSGAATIVYESEAGETVSPKGVKGVLSPFLATVELVVQITAGSFASSVSLGRFTVTRVPSLEDTHADVNGQRVVVASRVEIEFSSLDERIRRRGFDRPASPASTSCYREMRRITGMLVHATLPDATIPKTTVWEASDGARLAAVQDLADRIGGVAVVNSRGEWTIIPDAIGDVDHEITVGEDGTILALSDEVTTDGVTNSVVGVFEQTDRQAIYVQAKLTAGPLSVYGPYGENTQYVSSQYVTTLSEAQKVVQDILTRVTSWQHYDVAVTCHFNPLIEIGDTAKVTAPDREIVGRVVACTLSESHEMTLTVRTEKELR